MAPKTHLPLCRSVAVLGAQLQSLPKHAAGRPARSLRLSRTVTTATAARPYAPRALLKPQVAPCTRACQFGTTPVFRDSGVAAAQVGEPVALNIDDFHKLSDEYIDTLVAELEELQEEREEVDVEYSAGVLTLVFPPAGTYVLNKQPPNRQIWLSSPLSGPKRYDYVKTEGGEGDWIYMRDGSRLSELLRKELSIKLYVEDLDA